MITIIIINNNNKNHPKRSSGFTSKFVFYQSVLGHHPRHNYFVSVTDEFLSRELGWCAEGGGDAPRLCSSICNCSPARRARPAPPRPAPPDGPASPRPLLLYNVYLQLGAGRGKGRRPRSGLLPGLALRATLVVVLPRVPRPAPPRVMNGHILLYCSASVECRRLCLCVWFTLPPGGPSAPPRPALRCAGAGVSHARVLSPDIFST